MAIEWPLSLPRPNVAFSTSTQYTNTRLKMATGRVRQYPRYTEGIQRAQLRLDLTPAEMASFKIFYSEELEQGSLWFNMDVPNPDGEDVTNSEVRFSPAGYNEVLTNYNRWVVTATIEYMEPEILPPGSFVINTNADGSYDWPESLLERPSSFQVVYEPATAQSSVQSARDAFRKRATTHTEIARVSWQLNQEQYAIFVYTYQEHLRLGNDWFHMNLPVPSGAANYADVRARFASDFQARYVGVNDWDIQARIEYEIPEELSTANYLYELCDNPTAETNIIVAPQPTTVIKADGTCYAFVSETSDPLTSPAPVISGTFATCLECNPPNHKYRHCVDSITYPDIVFENQAANTVVETVDGCYSYLGTTTDPITTPAPTIIDTFLTCNICLGIIYEQWYKCGDDTVAFSLVPGATTKDYIWGCVSGVLEKCYVSGLTATAPTTPTIVEPTNTPTSCTDMTPPGLTGTFAGDYDAAPLSAGAKASWSSPSVSGGATVIADVYDLASRNTMRFDGASDYFQAAASSTLDITGALTFYIVCKSDNNHNGYILHKGENELANGTQYLFIKLASGNFLWRVGNGTTNYDIQSAGNNSLNLFTCQYNGSDRIYLRRNGTVVGDVAAPGSLTSRSDNFAIATHSGTTGGKTGYFDGDICEIKMVSSYQTGATLTENERNLCLKWGIDYACT